MAKKQTKQSPQNNTKQKSKLPYQKIVIAILAVAVIVFFIVNNFTSNESKVQYYKFKKEGELTFTDSVGNLKAKIDLEIADNEYERQLGLMNRNEMKDNEGMLFIFPDVDSRSFWMLNTILSLDMIFIDADKRIVTIHKNTIPFSQQSYPSSKPSIYVVEVLSGFTDKHNIQVGDKINWIGVKTGI